MEMWQQLVGSALAVVALTAAAYAMGFRQGPPTGEAELCAAAEAALPGFRARRATLSADGRLAEVEGVDGRRIALVARGDCWVARRQPQEAA